MLEWLEATRLATAIGASLPLIASLSAAHLLGFTLTMGSAMVANFRLLGIFLATRPVGEVTRPTGLGIVVGLLVSIATGLLLFAWRATELAANPTFQLKMLLLATAAAFHFTWHRRAARPAVADARWLRATGTIGLVFWCALALAGCALILLE